jgi:LCP family protein required for cell wall assembly
VAGLVLMGGAIGCYDSIAHPGAGSRLLSADYHPTLAQPLPPPFAGCQEVRILLIGADTRPGDRGRADALMLLWLNPRLHRAALLSVPRDLWWPIPGHGTTKINAAYAYGGCELTRQTVETLFGVDIPYYVKIDFDTFVKAVDMLGGVDLEVPDVEGHGRGMNYDDNWGNLHIHLKPGFQHLSGYQAMGFVRYRHGDTDYNRTRRQQQFLRAMLEQKVKVINLGALLRAGSYILRRLETNLSWRQVVDLVRLGREMSAEDLLTETLPSNGGMHGHVWYCTLLEDEFHELMTKVANHLSGQPVHELAVTVLNASGVPGAARQAAAILEAKGWTVAGIGKAAAENYLVTQIEYPAGGEQTAAAVARDLNLTNPQLRQTDHGLDKVRVRVGRDFHPQAF